MCIRVLCHPHFANPVHNLMLCRQPTGFQEDSIQALSAAFLGAHQLQSVRLWGLTVQQRVELANSMGEQRWTHADQTTDGGPLRLCTSPQPGEQEEWPKVVSHA